MSRSFSVHEFNSREFYRLRQAMKDAGELLESGHPRSALAALKKPKAQLEAKGIRIRMLALICVLEAEIFLALDQPGPAAKDLDQALDILKAIHDRDEALLCQIRQLQKKAGQNFDVR